MKKLTTILLGGALAMIGCDQGSPGGGKNNMSGNPPTPATQRPPGPPGAGMRGERPAPKPDKSGPALEEKEPSKDKGTAKEPGK